MAEKMNLSFEPRVAAMIRERAKQLGKPISRYLADLAEPDGRRHRNELAVEGYRALNADTGAFAESALCLSNETWPEWNEAK